MRKLASIQRIVSISPIPEADKIDRAIVLGWECVVKKGEFNPGDLVVYIEADSLLPFNPWTGESVQGKPLRLKIVKMKKQISQGLVLSIASLPQLKDKTFEEGQDITELLGIIKYEPLTPEAVRNGNAKGSFPAFIPKTDETRIQSCPSVLSRYPDIPFVMTEKLDGQSITCYYYNNQFGVCSRNLKLHREDNYIWRTIDSFKIEKKLTHLFVASGRWFAIQGELVGPGVQDNKLKLPGHRYYAFNLYDIEAKEYLPSSEFFVCCKKYSLLHVPLLRHDFLLKDCNIDTLLSWVEIKSSINPDSWMEGGVFRPAHQELRDPDLGRLSFKCINRQFLLHYGE